MRAQLITVFLVSFASFIGLLVWRVDDIMFSDKLAWSEAQSRSQMSPLIHSLEIELTHLSETLGSSLSQIRDAKKDYGRASHLARYQMVVGLKSLGQKEWSMDRPLFLEQSPAKLWAQQYLSLLLKNIDARDIKPGAFAAYSLLDPQRKSFLFLVHNMVVASESGDAKQTQWVGTLVGPEFFQFMMDRQKGQISSVFLVNQLGQALGHTTPEYVGNLLTEDPIVAELMKAQTGNGSGTFKNLKGEPIQGFYEQVEKSNVYAVITTPVGALLKNRDQVRMQILMLGFGLAFVGVAVFVLIYKPDHQSERAAKNAAQLFAPPAPSGPQKVVAAPTAAPVATPMTGPSGLPLTPFHAPAVVDRGAGSSGDKMEVFLRMASALSHEMKGPLAAILGHVQLLKTNPSSEEHLNGIEDQARKSRELIQKLMIFSGEDAPRFQKVKMTDLVRRALSHIESQVFRKGVHLNIENIRDVEAFDLPADLVCRAIENILNNSIEAMERAIKKELKISLTNDGGKIQLVISDTGEGIESQNLTKIFEPFYTTRARQHQAGLGLSMSLGIVKELNGVLTVESEKGKGTTVTMILDPSQIVATITPTSGPLAMGMGASSARAIQPPPLPVAAPKATMMVLDDREVEEVLGVENVTDATSSSVEAAASSESPLAPPVAPQGEQPLAEHNAAVRAENDKSLHQAIVASAKIDKPQISMPARSTKLDQVAFQIRRPNDKGFEKSGEKS